MATKSILKNITVKNKPTCRSLLSALEHANNKSEKKVTFSRPVRTADKELIKVMFSGENKK